MPSNAYQSWINSRTNADRLATLFHITHPGLSLVEFPNGILLTDLGNGITSNGLDYLGFPFTWNRPHKRHDRLPTVQVTWGNVDNRIERAVLPLQGKPRVVIQTVMESSPDVAEEGPFNLLVHSFKPDRASRTISAELGLNPMIWMGYGRHKFTPATAPGMFR